MTRIFSLPTVAIALTAIIGLYAVSVATVVGQDGANMVTEFKGKLKSFKRGAVVVTRDDDVEVTVMPPDEASDFVFIAEAKPAFLRQGMLVRFTGTFNPEGVATSPIGMVEIFQPVMGRVAGHMREKFTPGVHGAPQEAGAAFAEVGVVGAVVGMDATAMMVQAGQIPVRAPLAQDVKFEIRFNNLSLAQEGDVVNVSGFYNEPDDTKVKAERITIKVDRVYGEAPEKPVRASRTSRTRTEKPADAGTTDDAAAE